MKKVARNGISRKDTFSGSIWVGVDVHKKSYSVTMLDEEGRNKTFSMCADPLELIKKLVVVGGVVKRVVYEAGPCGFGLYRALVEHGIPATVVAPTRMPRPITRTGKTDSLDSRKLAEYAARDMLVPVRVPGKAEEGVRRLQRRRHKLTDLLRKNKQNIKSLLLESHIEAPVGLDTWSKSAISALKGLSTDYDTKMTLASLLREQEFILGERKLVDESFEKCLSDVQKKQIANLQSTPGVGPVLARTFVSEIFHPETFPDSEHFASFIGLAPILSQSGQSKATGSIVRNGQRRLRSLLIECAWTHKTRDANAESLYRRVLARTGLAQKAITAVARRLGILLWRLLVENRRYMPSTPAESN